MVFSMPTVSSGGCGKAVVDARAWCAASLAHGYCPRMPGPMASLSSSGLLKVLFTCPEMIDGVAMRCYGCLVWSRCARGRQ